MLLRRLGSSHDLVPCHLSALWIRFPRWPVSQQPSRRETHGRRCWSHGGGTVIRWHRSGFRCYWRWKSRSLGGRPHIEAVLRALIRQMSMENPLWGAPRIHGELLKLGFEVAQSSVAKYMVKRRGPPSQGWLTFLRNHAPDAAAMTSRDSRRAPLCHRRLH